MHQLQVTNNAASRILAVAKSEGNPKLRLRISVEGGGCSGFQYKMDFDDQHKEGEIAIRHGEAELVVDELTLSFMKGAVVDYVEDLAGGQFEIKNPNAVAKCGCGTSFAVDITKL
jgi:iron-sulfur cluster insertion protein